MRTSTRARAGICTPVVAVAAMVISATTPTNRVRDQCIADDGPIVVSVELQLRPINRLVESTTRATVTDDSDRQPPLGRAAITAKACRASAGA